MSDRWSCARRRPSHPKTRPICSLHVRVATSPTLHQQQPPPHNFRRLVISLSLCSSLSAQRPSKWPRTKELLDEAARHCNSDRMAFSALVISRPPPLLATAISVQLSNFGPMIVLFQKKTWPPDPHKMAPAKDFSVAAASNKCLPQDSVPRDHRRLTLNIRLLSEFCCASAVPSNFPSAPPLTGKSWKNKMRTKIRCHLPCSCRDAAISNFFS